MMLVCEEKAIRSQVYVPTVGNSKPASLRKFWMWALPAFKADKKNDEIDHSLASAPRGVLPYPLRWCTDWTILRYVARPIQWAVIRRDRLVGRPLPLKVSPALAFGVISIKTNGLFRVCVRFSHQKPSWRRGTRGRDREITLPPLILPAESGLLFILLVSVGEEVFGSPIINQSSVRTHRIEIPRHARALYSFSDGFE